MPGYLNTLLKIVLYLTLVLLGLYALVVNLGPFFAVHYVQQWYGEQHPDQRLNIDRADLSLWHGTLTLDGLTIEQADTGTIPELRLLQLERLELDWLPGQLFQQQFVGNVQLAGFYIQANNAAEARFKRFGFSEIKLDKSLQLSGDIQLSGLELTAEDVPPVSLASISLTGIYSTNNPTHSNTNNNVLQQHRVELFELNGLKIGESLASGNSLTELANYQIEDIVFSAQNATHKSNILKTGLHHYHGLMVNIHKLADGNIAGLTVAEAAADQNVTAGSQLSNTTLKEDEKKENALNEEEGEEKGEEKEIFSIFITGVNQTTQTPSYIQFYDQQITPEADVRVALKQLQLGVVDAGLKAEQWHLNGKIPLQLNLALDEYNAISLHSEMGLTADAETASPQGNIELVVDQLNLVPFNGYLADAMGYHTLHGSLDLTVNVAVEAGNMDGEAQIFLRNSKFTPVDQETIDRLSKQVSMPLDTALSILRDDNNNIRLNLPLSGPLDDPDVGLNDLINQLSILAMQEAVTYYLTQTLQPYTALISISSYAGDYLLAIRLDDLEFNSLQTELSDEHRDYLEKVAGMMLDKETLELKVCGFASEDEVALLAEKPDGKINSWQALAKEREAQIQRWFNQQHKELLKRVTPCHPQRGDKAVVSLGF